MRHCAQRYPAFREGLLKEDIKCLLGGEVDAGELVLRDYINPTIGFEELGSLTNKPPKSLMCMFGPAGNPHAHNLFKVISRIQQHKGVQLEVKAFDSWEVTGRARRQGLRLQIPQE